MADTSIILEEATSERFPDDPLTLQPNKAQTIIDVFDTWGEYISQLIDLIKGFFAEITALLS